MSNSRSPTPTPNLPFINTATTPSPGLTTSRSQTHDDRDTAHTGVEYSQESFILRTPTHTRSFESRPSDPGPSSRHLVRPAESILEGEPMAKRIRKASPSPKERLSPRFSPSSDSQDEMADNEMDSAKPQRSDQPPPTTSPVKKKRTRTLTTPHQSAVLHALLAQSRFPTTAMREEVGRSIGLSARKVQIWFQNQRQKARRPRSQSDIPENRLPRYGPFDSSSIGSFALVPDHVRQQGSADPSPHSDISFYERRGDVSAYSGHSHQSSESYNSPGETSARLLGPGVPGAETHGGPPPQFHSSGRIVSAPVSAPPTSKAFPAAYALSGQVSRPPFHSPVHMHPPSSFRPSTSQPHGLRERDFSRTLPPLPLSRPATSYSSSSHSSTGIPFGGPMPPFVPQRTPSPEIRFAHYPPSSSSPVILPPPFTLEPRPQWDDSAYIRPDSSAWSRPSTSHSTPRRSISPATRQWREDPVRMLESGGGGVEGAERRAPQLSVIPPLPARSGRYDPVRATFTPYAPRAGSPAGQSSESEEDEAPDREHTGEDHRS